MNANAAPQARVNFRFGFGAASVVALLAVLTALFGWSAVAGASPVHKDGKIYACYRVKGKPKGAMRVLFKGKHCKRGERRMAWIAAAPTGSSGSTGAAGQAGGGGSNGNNGNNGANGDGESNLQAKVSTLGVKIDGLEGVLEGVTNGELTDALNTVGGIDNSELTEAVGAVPDVKSLCGQTEELNSQMNEVTEGVEGLSLNGVLTTLGGILNVPALPELLDPYTCPAS
jgi:hypothetical protein